MKLNPYRLVRNTCALLLLSLPYPGAAQQTKILQPPTGDPARAQVVAGPEYRAGFVRRIFLGRHYRKEWTQAVWVPVLRLDTLGGLSPIQQGGGRQTTTLRLQDPQGKQYVLRSVNKDYSKALPASTNGTFIGRLAKDQVSTGHPYAALTVPPLAEAAGIFHTTPAIVLVPNDPRLGAYREAFANTLCLFEQRPDDNQEDASNFGNSEKVIGTEKLFQNLWSKGRHRVDQEAYVRARLFDMFLGDWGRHDDQWRWARFEEEGKLVYRPIPRDRDQTYALFDGIVPAIATTPEPLEVFQTFKGDIRNVKKYNFPGRFIDRQLANEVTAEGWLRIARDLQQRLSDAVIDSAVLRLPPEIYPFSGPEIARKLKSRRNNLETYARRYERYLAREVEITGTEGEDHFEARSLPDGRLELRVHTTDKEGHRFRRFHRIFEPGATREIRLFGLAGADVFDVEGDRRIRVRVIGSRDTDTVRAEGEGKKAVVYNNPTDELAFDGQVHRRISSDTSINRYVYRAFKPNSGHTIKGPSFNNLRGIYLNVGYVYRRYGFRKAPFNWEQRLRGHYSLFNKSFGGDYYGIFHQALGRWSLLLDARYDERLRHIFYGIGNESTGGGDRSFYRMFTNEGAASIGLQLPFRKHHRLGFTLGYEMIRVLPNPEQLAGKVLPDTDPSVFNRKHFGTGTVYYLLHAVNDEVLPTKGFNLNLLARYGRNLEQNRTFQRYEASASGYVPLSRVVSLVLRGGATTVNGQPEFYQLALLGGGGSLRGYRRERFYGRTMAFNQNELRFIWNWRSWLFNGRAGLMAFYDQGRVWQPRERSNRRHSGYGAGIIVVPFNRLSITVAYGITPEDRVVNLRLGSRVF